MRNVKLEVCSICHKKILPNEPAFVFDKNVVCLKCDESLRKPKPVPDSPLPGTTIATILEIIGTVSTVVFAFLFLIAIILPPETSGQESENIRDGIGLTGVVSIISLSVAAIIKAINANTEELRKIRYAMAKFFSEKSKNE